MVETKLDCQLGQVLTFCSCSCPLSEQQAGCLFGSISPFEYDRYLKQDSKLFFYLICRKICSRQSSYLIVHGM